MKKDSYLLFHLNLAFSSIEKTAYKDVINKCYWPILKIANNQNIKINIELSGWTLEQIYRIDKSWIDELNRLIDLGNIELIGSGYCQIIGPLNNHFINEKNQEIGIKIYKDILGLKPKIALLNEMAISSSMADIYSKYNFKAIIMDGLVLQRASDYRRNQLNILQGSERHITVIDSDFLTFQKMQHYAHGDISLSSWIDFITEYSKSLPYISLYSNDAETFDFRPGRFVAERGIKNLNEWVKIENAIDAIQKKGFNILLLSELLDAMNSKLKKNSFSINSLANVNPVKKQDKYNICRWALTGRNDIYLNSVCHSLAERYSQNKLKDEKLLKTILELSSSDNRTHITDRKWNTLKRKLREASVSIDHASPKIYRNITSKIRQSDEKINITKVDDNLKLLVSNKFFAMKLNLRRGLSIHSLKYKKHNWSQSIQTIEHGSLKNIIHTADFYSNHLIAEIPSLRLKITDLLPVNPRLNTNADGSITLSVDIDSMIGKIKKTLTIFPKGEFLLSYKFLKPISFPSIIRIGNFTFGDPFKKSLSNIVTNNGGRNKESLKIDKYFDHGKSVNLFVSSTTGIGATNGELDLQGDVFKYTFSWDRSKACMIPMVSNNEGFLRCSFSVSEIDDTSKGKTNFPECEILVSPY